MRHIGRLMVGLLILGGLAGLGHAQAGPEGPPPWIITKDPAESHVNIAVWMGPGPFQVGQPAQDFIHLALRQDACAYLLDIGPQPPATQGRVEVLLARCLSAGTYSLEALVPGLSVPQPEGQHFVQALATLFPIDLQEGRVLGPDPELVRLAIETRIRERGLGREHWAADWTTYRALRVIPFAGAQPQGYVRVTILDPQGREVPGATVSVGGGEFQSLPRNKMIQLSAGEHTFRARARFYRPDPQKACRVRKGGLVEDKPDCVVEVAAEDTWRNPLEVIFTLQPPDTPHAAFTVPDAICAGVRVEFDASPSGPQEQITEYLWDFGHGAIVRIARTDPETPPNPKVPHTFPAPGSYTVRLTVYFMEGPPQFAEHKATVINREECLIPPLPEETFPPNEPFLASIQREDGAIIETVRNGYALAIAQNVALPPSGERIRLGFNYQFEAFPFKDVEEGKAFVSSYVRLLFLDREGQPLPPGQQPPPLRVLEVGETPAVGPHQDYTSFPVSLPEGIPREELDIRVFVVTSVQATFEASLEPVIVRFQGFDVKEVPPSPECAALQISQQGIFRLGQTVSFEFRNDCDQPLTLPNSAPWVIKDNNGRIAFTPARQPGTILLPPGQAVSWSVATVPSWQAEEGKLVVPVIAGQLGAIYLVELVTQEGATYTAPFTIIWGF